MPPATKQGRNNIGDKKRWVRQRLSSAVLTSFRCQSKSMEDSVMFKIAVRSFSSPAMKQKPERRCQYSTGPHSLEEASRFQLHFINMQHAWKFFDLDQLSTLNTGSLSLDIDLSQLWGGNDLPNHPQKNWTISAACLQFCNGLSLWCWGLQMQKNRSLRRCQSFPDATSRHLRCCNPDSFSHRW